jgi:hypothetical protein
MANVADDNSASISECEIHMHHNPDAFVFWRNHFVPPFNQRWLILVRIRITKIKTQAYALELRDEWRAKTRGIQRYLAKAFYLAKPLVELGEAELEIVPWPLQEYCDRMKPYYKDRLLHWPAIPLEEVLHNKENSQFWTSKIEASYQSRAQELPSDFIKKKSLADSIRMVDIQSDAIKTLPLSLLERYLSVLVN